MNSALIAIVLLTSLVAVMRLGRKVRRHLPDHHLSADSKDAVKLAMGLVATMTALLLGLLVSSAKGTYDTQRSEVIQMAAKVAFLDHVLTAYGTDAAGARTQFRDAITEAVQRIWPDEAGARAELASNATAGDDVYAAIQRLSPRDETQRGLKAQAVTLAVDLGQLRMLLLAQRVPSIPKPLLLAVACWLLIIFFCFSLLAPPNATTALALIAAAVSVAVAVFLIMELDQPLGGLIRISGEPLRNVLSHLANLSDAHGDNRGENSTLFPPLPPVQYLSSAGGGFAVETKT